MEFEEVLTVHVNIEKIIEMHSDNVDSVCMILFKGNVTGKYFEGDVLPGGVDTQIIGRFEDKHTLSARYMLEGKDYTGKSCKIFIENNGNVNRKLKYVPFRTYPKIITDSKALEFLNYDLLVGEGVGTESGVDIKIYRQV
ncbi:hypothetical protein psyc5s11_15040 [Clostridium gelidum]|uniref:DUF3237 domain-containing protein n=1 Tax=Clostridium gelidum TaxID=704125 RepID=A0ABN6IY90_9CLOT|nr:DUF3237 family protein [Clostridium gelidum]BCZ45437.1 hypothetical protein psyc5s11_15040 [Clostridium gelidum]